MKLEMRCWSFSRNLLVATLQNKPKVGARELVRYFFLVKTKLHIQLYTFFLKWHSTLCEIVSFNKPSVIAIVLIGIKRIQSYRIILIPYERDNLRGAFQLKYHNVPVTPLYMWTNVNDENFFFGETKIYHKYNKHNKN